eukprot:scaffold5376_cov338-Prasinococcus_capsulatus_cf.AAC.4
MSGLKRVWFNTGFEATPAANRQTHRPTNKATAALQQLQHTPSTSPHRTAHHAAPHHNEAPPRPVDTEVRPAHTRGGLKARRVESDRPGRCCSGHRVLLLTPRSARSHISLARRGGDDLLRLGRGAARS